MRRAWGRVCTVSDVNGAWQPVQFPASSPSFGRPPVNKTLLRKNRSLDFTCTEVLAQVQKPAAAARHLLSHPLQFSLECIDQLPAPCLPPPRHMLTVPSNSPSNSCTLPGAAPAPADRPLKFPLKFLHPAWRRPGPCPPPPLISPQIPAPGRGMSYFGLRALCAP